MKKFTKLLLALGGISAVGAGLAVGMVNNNAKVAEPVQAETTSGLSKIYLTLNSSYWGQANADYYAHVWDGTNGTTWPGISLGSGSGTATLSGDVGTYSGYTHIIISRWAPGTSDFTGNPWNKWNYFDSTAMTSAELYNAFSNTAWDSCTSSVTYTISEKSELVEFGIQTATSLGFESVASGSAFTPSTPAAKDGYEFQGWFSDTALENAYGSNVTITSDATIYAKYTMTEETFATHLLSNTDTECASKAVALSTWANLKTGYLTMSDTQQNAFRDAPLAATYDSGTTVQKAAARYNEIVKAYGYENFANRSVSGASIVSKNTNNDSSSTIALGGLAMLAVLAAGGYFFVRKKKSI